MDTGHKSNFSNQRSAIPFGKFESGSDDEFPCNESMVGREGARAKLIDFLTNAGTRKAILITGRRGTGKTSFVQYCLKEYEEARIERYWRSDVGRTMSALVWLLFISLLYALVFVIGSRILQILLFNALNPDNRFLWIPSALLVICLSFPLFYAGKIFATIFNGLPISPNFASLLIVVLVMLVYTHLPGSGSPIVTLSYFISVVASAYFFGELIDYIPPTLFGNVCKIVNLNLKEVRFGGPIILIFSVITYLLSLYFNPIINYAENYNFKGTSILFSNLLITCVLLGFAALNRSIGLARKLKSLEKFQISSVLKKNVCWFFMAGLLFLMPTLILALKESLNIELLNKLDVSRKSVFIIFLILSVVTVTRFILLLKYFPLKSEEETNKFHRRFVYPSAMLSLKAIFFILLGLYTLHPLTILVNPPQNNQCCSWGITKINHNESTNKKLNDFLDEKQELLFLSYNRPYFNVKDSAVILNNSIKKSDQTSKELATNYLSLFPRTKNELAYIAIIVAIVALLFLIEYEWIIRPNQFTRRDRSSFLGRRPNYYDDSHPAEKEFPKTTESVKNIARKLIRNNIESYLYNCAEFRDHQRTYEAITFLGYFNHFHLSTIITTINLGFEELDHRSVIHAMLLGIRDQYYEKFVSPRSPRVLIRSTFGLFLTMILVTDIAANRFDTETEKKELLEVKKSDIRLDKQEGSDKQSKQDQRTTGRYAARIPSLKEIELTGQEIIISEYKKNILVTKYCKSPTNAPVGFHTYDSLPKVPSLLCELGGFYAEKILPIIYFELVPINLPKDGLPEGDILNWPFDVREPYYNYNLTCDPQKQPNQECILVKPQLEGTSISFCVYHAFLFGFVFYLFRRFNRKFELVPYTFNLEKIDELINALTSTSKTKKDRDFPKIFRWSSALSGNFQENERSVEREKLDPRQVELQFMDVLEKICHSRPIYFKPLHSSKSAPTIEITFIFDELDKLATDINSQQQKGNPDGNDSELHRLNLMKGLLSNIKRIITASEARYIFLGGRLLHDDWLADSARRQPLMTSIFTDEIYLPSLLTDANIDWFDNNREHDDHTLSNNHPLHERIEEYFVWQFYMSRIRFKYWATRIWTPILGLRERDARPRSFMQCSYKNLKLSIKDADLGKIWLPLETIPIRYTDNGKHLNDTNENSGRELSRLNAFIHFLSYRSAGNPKRLNELLASFMMSVDRVVPKEEARNLHFICQDVLYLPDHKVMRIQLIARIYQQLRKGFEDKIRGRDDKTIVALIYMSDFLFKFHSRAFSWENLELIDELVHMHRGHDLRSLLHELVEHFSDRYLHRIINGMYTFRFRSYFTNEIEYLSRHSEEEMAAFNFTLDEAQSLRDHFEKLIEKGENRDKTDVLNRLGELHEFYQEYERARFYYRRCISTRHLLFREYVGDKLGKGDDEIEVLQAFYTNTPAGRKALIALQNWAPSTLRLYLKIVITYEREHNDNEAMNRCKLCIKFAESMIQAFATVEIEKPIVFIPCTEKNKTGENALSNQTYILEYLGLLFEPLFTYAWLLEKNSYTSGNSFQVLQKGVESFEKVLSTNPPEPLKFVRAQWQKKVGALCFYKGYAMKEGKPYVQSATGYYSNSAESLSQYFRQHIKTTFKPDEKVTSFREALLQNNYPAEYCLSVAECLGDLSESILAEITPTKLFDIPVRCLSSSECNFEDTAKTLVQMIDRYFFSSASLEEGSILELFANTYDDKSQGWAGLVLQHKFDIAINLSLASSFYMLRANNLESAAREVMHTAEVIAQYFNWYWFDFTIQGRSNHEWKGFKVIQRNMEKVNWLADFLLPWMLREVRPKIGNKNTYLMGDLIPSSALTSLCSIGLSLSFFLQLDDHTNSKLTGELEAYLDKLSKIIEKWTGEEIPSRDGSHLNKYDYFEQKLIYSLQRHRYPVLNQLNALNTLSDARLIHSYLLKITPNSSSNKSIIITHDWLDELYKINKKYNHPLHYTPMQLGLSLYLYAYLKKNEFDEELKDFENFDLYSETRQLLVQSLDMCHMGRAYYQAIDKLYYLYDDFNDSQIHRNHAMQMAGTELTQSALANFKKIEN